MSSTYALLKSVNDIIQDKPYYMSAASQTRADSLIPRETIALLIEGNHQAFDIVFYKYYPRVKSFLLALTKSVEISDEITQQVFVSLWEKRGQIDADKNFNAYIYTIARNHAFAHFRKVNVQEEFIAEKNTDAEGFEDSIFAREAELLIKLTVSRMPDRRRQIYELSREEGKDNATIARELNITRKAVEKHLRLALSDIKHVLQNFIACFWL